jgi:hypothetical protein
MSDHAQFLFLYEALDPDTRLFVQQKTDELHGLMKRTAESIIRIGQHLLSVKACLGHGHFETWLRAEFGMTDRHARRFMNVAERFGDIADKMSVFSVSVLYELATASTSDNVIDQVITGQIAPAIEAIKAAKETERLANEAAQRARADQELAQRQLHQERAAAQDQHDLLTREIEELTQQIALLQASPLHVREVPVTPPEVLAQLEAQHRSVQTITQQRDALSRQVAELGEQARVAALKRDEDEHERRIRLNWYRVTTEFRTSVLKLLSQWPSPLDVLAFEADDWLRLSDTKDLARRLLEECTTLTRGTEARVVDGSMVLPEEVIPGLDRLSPL